jgi:hypothetical protein
MSAASIVDINWAELFSRFINVTTMQAIGDGTSNLVRALTASTITNAGPRKKGRKRKHNNRESTVQLASTVAHAHTAIFPKLKFLGLANQNFHDSKHLSGIPFDIFERGLQQRMVASGVPLRSLYLSDCDISTEHAKALQMLVEDFSTVMRGKV